jgi:hypothetical protein
MLSVIEKIPPKWEMSAWFPVFGPGLFRGRGLTPSPDLPISSRPLVIAAVAPGTGRAARKLRETNAKSARKTVSEKINTNKTNMLNVIKKFIEMTGR